jgi:hypothetical protein
MDIKTLREKINDIESKVAPSIIAAKDLSVSIQKLYDGLGPRKSWGLPEYLEKELATFAFTKCEIGNIPESCERILMLIDKAEDAEIEDERWGNWETVNVADTRKQLGVLRRTVSPWSDSADTRTNAMGRVVASVRVGAGYQSSQSFTSRIFSIVGWKVETDTDAGGESVASDLVPINYNQDPELHELENDDRYSDAVIEAVNEAKEQADRAMERLFRQSMGGPPIEWGADWGTDD